MEHQRLLMWFVGLGLAFFVGLVAVQTITAAFAPTVALLR